MRKMLDGLVTVAASTLLLSGCVYYRQPPTDPNDPQFGGQAAQPQQAGEEQPGVQPENQPPPSVAQQTPADEPAVPRRRRRPTPRVDVAPRVTAATVFGEGTGGAFRGLIYLMPDDSSTLPDFSRLTPIGEVFTDHFDVKPQEFHGGFPGISKEEEWFAIKYEGTVMLPEGGAYRFKLVSDDGSALYIDGTKIIENDGVHGPRALANTANLAPGRHQLRLDYFQGNRGPIALQLFVTPPSGGGEMLLQGVR